MIWECFYPQIASWTLKRKFDDSKIVFLSLEESYRFLISTCYFAHLDGLSAENVILDMISCAISI